MAVRFSSLRVGRPSPPRRFLVFNPVRGWVDPRAIVRLEWLGQLKKFNDIIGIRTRDFPACSILPQPTTLPRVPFFMEVFFICIITDFQMNIVIASVCVLNNFFNVIRFLKIIYLVLWKNCLNLLSLIYFGGSRNEKLEIFFHWLHYTCVSSRVQRSYNCWMEFHIQ
jgi:hypothetical protein